MGKNGPGENVFGFPKNKGKKKQKKNKGKKQREKKEHSFSLCKQVEIMNRICGAEKCGKKKRGKKKRGKKM